MRHTDRGWSNLVRGRGLSFSELDRKSRSKSEPLPSRREENNSHSRASVFPFHFFRLPFLPRLGSARWKCWNTRYLPAAALQDAVFHAPPLIQTSSRSPATYLMFEPVGRRWAHVCTVRMCELPVFFGFFFPTNVMFFSPFFSLLFLPALNLLETSAVPTLRGRASTWNTRRLSWAEKQLWKSFLPLSADRCFAGFCSCHQYKHCNPPPRPWYSCLFTSTIHPDASWGKRKKQWFRFFILPAVKDLIPVREFTVCRQ